MLSAYRSIRRRVPRILLVLFLAWNFLDVLLVRHRLFESARNVPLRGQGAKEKIFIASTHWNNEAVIREYWGNAVLALVDHFGPENLFVSIYESGSWDNTKDALRSLDAQLGARGVPKNVVLNETTHEEDIVRAPTDSGWIDTPRGKKELRRIPYLSSFRNLSLKPLEELARAGQVFDKILFLNDVVFRTQDVLTLINTNDGVYAAACALDYSKPPQYYDTFALRDSDGSPALMQVWPYFKSRKARSSMKRSVPFTLDSCWNGMVIMDAEPFYHKPSSPALQFRGISDSLAIHHLEGSECCLIHADNPLTSLKHVWLNPNVRVGYNGPAYETVNPEERLWLSAKDVFLGLWKNRLLRWWPGTWVKTLSVSWTVDKRLKAWQNENEGVDEPGRYCLINEMQVLVGNGWAHV